MELPEEGYDRNQTPFRQGRADYITVGNKEQALRTWDPVRNEYKFIVLGRTFYRNRVCESIVSIPATIQGRRINGSEYELRGFMPTSALNVPKILAGEPLMLPRCVDFTLLRE